MIFELLNTGKHRPITGSRLAEILGTDTRTVAERIERERKAGKPICATCNGSNPGYYLAETKEDAAEYCDRLKGRAIAIFATMHAVEKAGNKLPSREDAPAADTETDTKPN